MARGDIIGLAAVESGSGMIEVAVKRSKKARLAACFTRVEGKQKAFNSR